MAELFDRQAALYSKARPTYPPELFDFILSKTPSNERAWDAGSGSGQAAISLSKLFHSVVATDVSKSQLERAPDLSNVTFRRTPERLAPADLERLVGARGTVDLVTVAQAIHWFDLPHFYESVKLILKRPHGVIAVWCYKTPRVSEEVDALLKMLYEVDSAPYWHHARKLVDGAYQELFFPFEAVEGEKNTGAFEFVAHSEMGLEDYLAYFRSWSAYQTAKQAGVELLNDQLVERFKRAWMEDGLNRKIVNFPIYLKIGRMGEA